MSKLNDSMLAYERAKAKKELASLRLIDQRMRWLHSRLRRVEKKLGIVLEEEPLKMAVARELYLQALDEFRNAKEQFIEEYKNEEKERGM